MDTERIRKLKDNPAVSRLELEKLFNQTLSGNDRALAFEIREVIDERFGIEPADPEEHKAASASFRSIKRSFHHAKDAYLWLVENFIELRPEIFTEPALDTTGLIALGRARNSEGKPFRNYFARSPQGLFRSSPELAEQSDKYAQLRNNWYANINLNNVEKFDLLNKFGNQLSLVHGKDWSFLVENPTAEFQARINRPTSADELFAELYGRTDD